MFTNLPGHFYSCTQQILGATGKARLWNRNPGSWPPIGGAVETTWVVRRLRPGRLQCGSGEVAPRSSPELSEWEPHAIRIFLIFFFLKTPACDEEIYLLLAKIWQRKFQCQMIEPFAIQELTVLRFVLQPLRCRPLGATLPPPHPPPCYPPPGLCPAHLLARVWEEPKLLTCDLGRLYFSGQE